MPRSTDDPRREPALEPALRAAARRRRAACSTSCRRTCARAARTSRSSRSARATASSDGAPHEWWRLGVVLTGAAEARAWNRPLRPVRPRRREGRRGAARRELGLRAAGVRADAARATRSIPGRSAHVVTSRPRTATAAGWPASSGELHPDVLERWEIRAERVVAAELAIARPRRRPAAGRQGVARAAIPGRGARPRRRRRRRTRPPSSSSRQSAARPATLLRDLRLFDVYPMADGERSLAFRLTFQAPDRTLTEAEIDEAVCRAMRGLERTGGRLRT